MHGGALVTLGKASGGLEWRRMASAVTRVWVWVRGESARRPRGAFVRSQQARVAIRGAKHYGDANRQGVTHERVLLR